MCHSIPLWILGVLTVFAQPAVGQTVLRVDCDRLNGPGAVDDDPGPYDGLTWQTAFGHVDDALDEARSLFSLDGTQAELWIAEGLYVPGGGYQRAGEAFVPGSQSTANSFMPAPGVDLTGGFMGDEVTRDEARPKIYTSTLSGDLAGNGSVGARCRVIHIPSTDETDAGAIYIFEGLTIEGGGTPGEGGGILYEGPYLIGAAQNITSAVRLVNSRITDCQAGLRGGAIGFRPPARGAAISDIHHRVQLYSSEIEGCIAGVHGGAIYHYQRDRTQIQAIDSTFTGNIAGATDAGGNGGAIRVSAAQSTADSSRMIITGSRFFENRAARGGGAIHTDGRCEPIVHSSAFVGNRAVAGSGGAIYQWNSWFSISASVFWFNQADGGNGHSFYQRKDLHYNATNGADAVLSSSVFAVDALLPGNNIHFSNDTGQRWGVTGDSTVFYNGIWERDSDSTNGSTTMIFLESDFTEFVDLAALFDLSASFGADATPGTTDDLPQLAAASPLIDAGRYDKFYSDGFDSRDRSDVDGDGDSQELYPLDAFGGNRLVDIGSVLNTGTGQSVTGEDQSFMDIGGTEVQACQDCEGERVWSNPNGGPFGIAPNWFPGTPGIGNTAVFDLDVFYGVDLKQNVTTAGLRARNGQVTLNLNNFAFSLSDFPDPDAPGVPRGEFRGLIVGESSDASLTIRDGTFVVPVDSAVDIGLRTGSNGILEIDDATLLVDEVVRVGPRGDGSLLLRNDAAVITTDLRIGDSSSTAGLVEIDGPLTFIDAIEGATIESGTLRLVNGASVYAGIPGFSGVFVKDGGRIEGDGTIVGNVLNRGEVVLGDSQGEGTFSPSLLSVVGDYLQLDEVPSPTQSRVFSGKLLGRVGADADGIAVADRLDVAGRAILGGGLVLSDQGGLVPMVGGQLPPVLTADEIVAGESFDVVLSPVLQVDSDGDSVPGTLVPEIGTTEGQSGTIDAVNLRAITLGELIFGSDSFSAQGTPNDAVIADVTGDGIDDIVVAVPDLSKQGAVVLFEGTRPGGPGTYAIGGTVVIFETTADAPIAVEAADFDNDGVTEIAFANRGDFESDTSVRFIEFSGGSLGVSSDIDVLGLNAGEVCVDLAAGEFMAGGPEAIDLAVLIDTTSPGSLARIASGRTGGMSQSWDFCDLPIDDDQPDSSDPIDVDGTSATFGLGLAVTTRGEGRLSVFLNDGPMPEDWSSVVVPTGAGPRDVRAGDLDLDGLADLVVINQDDASITVIRNAGGGELVPPVIVPASDTPISLALADLDDDMDRDVVIVAFNSSGDQSVLELRNTTTAPGSITLAAATDTPNQPTGDPVLIRSADLDLSNPNGLDDDLVILVDPASERAPGGERLGTPENVVRLSESNWESCPADVNGDGLGTPADFTAWLGCFNNPTSQPFCSRADVNGSGTIDPADFTAWLAAFNAGCQQ